MLPATAIAWNVLTGSSWNSTADWTTATIPNNWSYIATFGTIIGSTTATVTLDSSPTVSGLVFNNTSATSSYVISRSGGDTTSTLTLNNGAAPATVTNSANNTIAVPIVLDSNLAVSSSSGKTLTISGIISGTAALTYSGAGSLVLSASDTYTGVTTISAGTLQLGNSTSNGYVAGNITDNARLIFANPSAQTYSGVISGTGSLTKTTASVLVLTGSETYNGNTSITGGTLQLGDGVTYNGSVAGAIADSGCLTFANPNAQTYGSVISGTGTVTMLGPGTLTLTASNTYSGLTTLSAGQLNINAAHAVGSGSFTIAGGTIGNSSGAAITLSSTGAESWNSNIIFVGPNDLNLGTGAVAMSSSRTVTVASNNLTVGGAISGSTYSLTKAGAAR